MTENKSIPSILSKLRSINRSSSRDSRDDGSNVGTGLKTRPEGRPPPKLAWMAKRDSNAGISSSSASFGNLLNNNNGLNSSMNSNANNSGGGGGGGGNGSETPKSVSILSRVPSLMNLGGTSTSWGKRLRKKRDAEEYAAQKLARQKEEMIAFYRGTPVVDDRATSTEILRFLYKMWEPQLCDSYRRHVPITTTCRQDMRNARKMAQTTPRRVIKLHRARIVIDTCNQFSGSAFRPDSARRSSSARPRSAKSVT